MKKLFFLFIISWCTITTVWSQCPVCETYSKDIPPATKKWSRMCEKKVIKPLKKAAEQNPTGSLEFIVRTYTPQGMRQQHVQLDYVNKMAFLSTPYMSVCVDHDTTYYVTKDSTYIFNRNGELIGVRFSLDRQLDLFFDSPFLSFYAYLTFQYNACAVRPFLYKKNKERLVADFVSPLYDDGDVKTMRGNYLPGRHRYVLDCQQNALVRYIYEPCAEYAQHAGYTKISYQVLRKNPLIYLDYPSIIDHRIH